jgi:hypothetical protein
MQRLDAPMPRHLHHLEHIGAVLERRGDEASAQGVACENLRIVTRGGSIALHDLADGDVGENNLAGGTARPTGNAAGFANIFASLGGKWLELLKEAAPGITRVADCIWGLLDRMVTESPEGRARDVRWPPDIAGGERSCRGQTLAVARYL